MMLNRLKTVMNNAVGNLVSDMDSRDADTSGNQQGGAGKYTYNRPPFLQLNPDEVQVSADHGARPIIVPRDITRLPWCSGYAEVINAGKTRVNEDQARAETILIAQGGLDPNLSNGLSPEDESLSEMDKVAKRLRQMGNEPDNADFKSLVNEPLAMVYFGLFDGHAGSGAAIMAVNCLHEHIRWELSKLREMIVAKHYNFNHCLAQPHQPLGDPPRRVSDRTFAITGDQLIIGALEQAFQNMDNQIERDRHKHNILGGCAAIAAIFMLGKLYVANAGDSRAVLCRGTEVIPMSHDFTPESERNRVNKLGFLHPEWLHNEFTHLEFPRRLFRQDIGKDVLYRDAWMKGWSIKKVTHDDIKFPLVFGQGKKARVLATIGVTRGFGDHDLRVHETNIYIKPFLSAVPEVEVYDMRAYNHSEDDVLIMGSDGFWDVTSNEQAVMIARECLQQFKPADKSRYTSAAQELVMYARGLLESNRTWKMKNNRIASGDDITCFVIPLHCYSSSLACSSSQEWSVDQDVLHISDDEPESPIFAYEPESKKPKTGVQDADSMEEISGTDSPSAEAQAVTSSGDSGVADETSGVDSKSAESQQEVSVCQEDMDSTQSEAVASVILPVPEERHVDV